jgi:hypothetical protein
MIIFDSSILPECEIADSIDSKLSHNNGLLYGDWLFDLFKGKTWAALNFNWPLNSGLEIPNDRDVYIFSWHLESWPYDWLIDFADAHPNQQIVVIGEFDAVPLRPNISVLKYHCWHIVVPAMLAHHQPPGHFQKHRDRLLSCLCGKPNFSRALLYAYYTMHWCDDPRIVFTWNTRPGTCGSLNELDTVIPIQRLENLRQTYLCNDLSRHTVEVDVQNTSLVSIWNHWNFQWPGAKTWINVTNETYCRSDWPEFGIEKMPGPYLSEKTWKALISGLALVPNGQPGTYRHLESMGFDMQYPWPKDFDDIFGDMSRLDRVLDTIDWILQHNESDIIDAIMPSCEHNFYHVRSDTFQSNLIDINHRCLENFLRGS